MEYCWLCWGLTSQSTIFQSYRDGAIASWVINQYFRGVKWLAQGHNTAAVGLEPRTSRSGVRQSTTEPPRSPHFQVKWHKIGGGEVRWWEVSWGVARPGEQKWDLVRWGKVWWGNARSYLPYFDKILQTIWCWKDLAQGIAKWHLSSVEALPSAKFWKSENGLSSWTEWNILINFCVNIDTDKI